METFYPGNVLWTAREIITLWVSRMVMMGQYCVGDIPFSDVYIHAMIQDGQGRKMSKSLGNGIDPLVAIDSHGADAMRFTLASMTTNTQDIRMPVVAITLADGRTVNSSAKFDGGRNFCNKLWNASRFAMMNLEGIDAEKFDASKMDTADKWILSQTARTIDEVTKALGDFKYNEPLSAIYRFFWNDFCDWYLEWAKPRMQDDSQRPIAQSVLAFVLDRLLRLLHPFVPFITEAIFQKLNEIAPVRKLKGIADAEPADALIIARWPGNIDSLIDEDAEKQILTVQSVARSIRDIKTKYNKANTPIKLVSATTATASTAKILNDNSVLIRGGAGVVEFTVGVDIEKPENAASAIIDDIQIYIPDMINKEAERSRLQKQKQQVDNGIKGSLAKLNNENFVTRAKPEVVAQAKENLKEAQAQAEAIDKLLKELDS
jgi:valyl-tRNA synthetase